MQFLLSLLLTTSTVLSMPVNAPALSRRQFNSNSNLDASTNTGTNTAISIPDGPVYNDHDFFTDTYTENTAPNTNSGEVVGYTEAGSDINIAIPDGPSLNLGDYFENTYQESYQEDYHKPETTPIPIPQVTEEPGEIPTPSLPLPPPPTSVPPSVDLYTPVPLPPVETGESENETPIPETEDNTVIEGPEEPVEEEDEEIETCPAPEPGPAPEAETEFVNEPQNPVEKATGSEPRPVMEPNVGKSCSCA
ncbi:hypothetical protein BDW60DRAFT_92986 [Aspergillus nidulans var. acristatus]